MNTKLTIKLFKAVCGKEFKGISEKALSYGILMPDGPSHIIDYAIKTFGIDGSLFNSAFHKNFKTVRDTDDYTLLIHQALHYFTTYGTNFQSEFVYIPAEKLEIPSIKTDKIKLINIQNLTIPEIYQKIINLCSIALSTETVSDVATLIQSMEHEMPEIYDQVIWNAKNKEVKCVLCKLLNTVPKDANEFLRYCIFLATGNTLKIKDRLTLFNCFTGKNVLSNQISINDTFRLYVERYGTLPLVHVYNANKKIFLTLKNSGNASIINKISKQAKKKKNKIYSEIHTLGILTNTDIPWDDADKDDFFKDLSSVSIFKEFSLLEALNYRLSSPKYIEYKIRNGKSYLTEAKKKDLQELQIRKDMLLEHLTTRLGQKFSGKKFYIPENITYSLPTSEKDFVGNIPNKSKIVFPSDNAMVIAICWETECDLDLSVLDSNGCKIGWNGTYKGNNLKVLFSGDMTHLDSNGKASEAMYIEGGDYSGSVKVNLFSNFSGKDEIPFKLVIAKSDVLNTMPYGTDYVIDPNSVLETINMKIDRTNKEFVIGTFSNDGEQTVFTFDVAKTGNRIASYHTKVDDMRLAVNSIKEKCKTSLETILKIGGGEIVNKYDETDKSIVDLSFENLSKETLLTLFTT